MHVNFIYCLVVDKQGL